VICSPCQEEQEGEERHVGVPDPEYVRQGLEQLREDASREHPERQDEPDDRVALLQLAAANQLQHECEEEDRCHRREDPGPGREIDLALGLGHQHRDARQEGQCSTPRQRPTTSVMNALNMNRTDGKTVR
jgi:hypothetical protein